MGGQRTETSARRAVRATREFGALQAEMRALRAEMRALRARLDAHVGVRQAHPPGDDGAAVLHERPVDLRTWEDVEINELRSQVSRALEAFGTFKEQAYDQWTCWNSFSQGMETLRGIAAGNGEAVGPGPLVEVLDPEPRRRGGCEH